MDAVISFFFFFFFFLNDWNFKIIVYIQSNK